MTKLRHWSVEMATELEMGRLTNLIGNGEVKTKTKQKHQQHDQHMYILLRWKIPSLAAIKCSVPLLPSHHESVIIFTSYIRRFQDDWHFQPLHATDCAPSVEWVDPPENMVIFSSNFVMRLHIHCRKNKTRK